MTAPFLPIHEFILLRASDHPAWPHMVREAIKRGLPKFYVRDLVFHDVNDLRDEIPKDGKFYWCIRTCGTFLSQYDSVYRLSGRSDDQWAWFRWDGERLNLLEESNG